MWTRILYKFELFPFLAGWMPKNIVEVYSYKCSLITLALAQDALLRYFDHFHDQNAPICSTINAYWSLILFTYHIYTYTWTQYILPKINIKINLWLAFFVITWYYHIIIIIIIILNLSIFKVMCDKNFWNGLSFQVTAVKIAN